MPCLCNTGGYNDMVCNYNDNPDAYSGFSKGYDELVADFIYCRETRPASSFFPVRVNNFLHGRGKKVTRAI